MRVMDRVCFSFCVSAGTGQYFVLDGQHKFSAAMRIRRKLETNNRPVPAWCRRFRCKVIKSDLPLDMLQKIAGKEQAKAMTVAAMTFTQTMQLYKKEVDAVQAEAAKTGEEPVVSRKDILHKVYDKTGKTPKFDGPVVCSQFPVASSLPLQLLLKVSVVRACGLWVCGTCVEGSLLLVVCCCTGGLVQVHVHRG